MFKAGGAAAGGGSVGGIFFLVIILVVGFMIYKKKKSDREANPFLSGRKNKDEVWRTIKQFLKDKGETKELVDSYVVKRDSIDMVNPNWSELERLNKNSEVKIRKWQDKLAKDKAKAEGTTVPEKPRARDLFVVVFKTRDAKTKVEDPMRCFECEVVQTKINKKEMDRKVVINKECDLDKEMEWIAPVRSAELAKQKAIDEKIAKQKEQQAKAEMKRRERVEKRAQKHAKK